MVGHHPISQYGHAGVAWRGFASFVDGDDAVFLFVAALLAREGDFALDGHAYIRPGAGEAFAPLNNPDLPHLSRFVVLLFAAIVKPIRHRQLLAQVSQLRVNIAVFDSAKGCFR